MAEELAACEPGLALKDNMAWEVWCPVTTAEINGCAASCRRATSRTDQGETCKTESSLHSSQSECMWPHPFWAFHRESQLSVLSSHLCSLKPMWNPWFVCCLLGGVPPQLLCTTLFCGKSSTLVCLLVLVFYVCHRYIQFHVRTEAVSKLMMAKLMALSGALTSCEILLWNCLDMGIIPGVHTRCNMLLFTSCACLMYCLHQLAAWQVTATPYLAECPFCISCFRTIFWMLPAGIQSAWRSLEHKVCKGFCKGLRYPVRALSFPCSFSSSTLLFLQCSSSYRVQVKAAVSKILCNLLFWQHWIHIYQYTSCTFSSSSQEVCFTGVRGYCSPSFQKPDMCSVSEDSHARDQHWPKRISLAFR